MFRDDGEGEEEGEEGEEGGDQSVSWTAKMRKRKVENTWQFEG